MTSANGWPLKPLGEAVTHRKEFVQIDDFGIYRRCRVQLHAQGVVLRDEVAGAMVKTKKQQVCRANEFLVAEIDAKMGGFGVVPADLEGAIVSSHYFLFSPKHDRLDPSFLGYFCRTPWFQEQVTSRGTTNYAAIRPSHVLDYRIPLPSLDVQRRIVARLDHLAAKLDEGSRLAREADVVTDSFLMATYHKIAESAARRPFGEVAPLTRRPAVIDALAEYPQVSVRSFGKGTFHNPPLLGREITWQKPFLVRSGDILVSNIKAWEGAIAVAGPDDDGRYGSHRYLTFVPVDGVATAHFLCFHLLSPEGLYHVGEASPGSADRNRTLSAKAMLEIPVPVPPYEQQIWFDGIWSRVMKARRLRREAAAARDAVLPAILDRAFRGELS